MVDATSQRSKTDPPTPRTPSPERGLPLHALFGVATRLLLAVLTLLASPAVAEWPSFRGGPQQLGVAESDLPAHPVPLWTFRVPDGVEATAAIVDGTVYVGGLGGTFHALDLATGEERWRVEIGEEIKSSPLVAGGVVYFGDELGGFHAVDARTGQDVWKFEAGAAITSSPNLAQDDDGACLVFGSYDNSIYCVNAKDGTKRWSVETHGYVHGSPAIDDGRVISSGCDGFLRVLDARTGELVEELEIGSYVAASPAFRGGDVYFGTFDNEVLAVDLESDEVVWRYEHPERDFPFYSSPAIDDGILVVGGRDKMVHGLDLETGEARWTVRFRSRVDASPVIVGSGDDARAFVADTSGLLQALSLADGSVLWEFEGGDGFVASPAVSDGRLVISGLDGTVFAFGSGAAAAQ